MVLIGFHFLSNENFYSFSLSLLSFVMTKYSTQRVMMLLRSKARLRSSLCVVVTIAVTMDINYASFFFSLMDRYLIGKSNHRPLYSLYGIYYSHDHFLVTLTQRQEQRERKREKKKYFESHLRRVKDCVSSVSVFFKTL